MNENRSKICMGEKKIKRTRDGKAKFNVGKTIDLAVN